MQIRKHLPLVAIAILALSNIMCGFGAFDYYSDRFTRTKPEIGEFSGDYYPTEATLKLITEIGKYNIRDSKITLSPDGSFEVLDMPDWWLIAYEKESGGFLSGKGEWTFSQQPDWWEVVFTFKNVSSSTLPYYQKGFGAWVSISGEESPYSLLFFIGNPDTARVMIFQQAEVKP